MLAQRALNAAAAPDLVGVYIVPLILALLGIGGIALGAWISARSALRSRLIDINVEEADREREFGARAVAAISDLGITTHHVIEDLRLRGAAAAAQANGPARITLTLDPALVSREQTATDRWRGVLAEAHFYTAGNLGDAFWAFDKQREVVVQAVNQATNAEDLAAAQAECDAWRDYYARQVYRLLQVDKVRGRGRVYHLAHERRLRGFVKSLAQELQTEMDNGEQLVRDEQKRHERD